MCIEWQNRPSSKSFTSQWYEKKLKYVPVVLPVERWMINIVYRMAYDRKASKLRYDDPTAASLAVESQKY